MDIRLEVVSQTLDSETLLQIADFVSYDPAAQDNLRRSMVHER